MTAEHIAVVQAVTATAAFADGLFFLRFWRQSQDTLFAYFGAAFWFLAASWTLLAFLSPRGDALSYIYAIRLVAFLLVIAGVIAKNRRS